MACPICEHPKRAEIEQELMCRSMGDLSVSLESVAKKYNVEPLKLQIHTLMHSTLPDATDAAANPPTTLVSAIKFKEAEYLRQTTLEYQNTLALLGNKLRMVIRDHNDDNPSLQKITRATVDLYLGLGGEIRGSVDSLVRMNNLINGDTNSGLEGLSSLVRAIKESSTDGETK